MIFDPFTSGNTTTAPPPVATSTAKPDQTAKLGVATAEMTRKSAPLAAWEIRRLMGAPRK